MVSPFRETRSYRVGADQRLQGRNPGIVAEEKRVEYDIWYIENWNILLDLKIIFLTFVLLLKGDENAV